jgi:cell division protein FtsI/penicillin-binding protein 2
MSKSISNNTKYIKAVFVLLSILLVFQLFRIQILENNKWTVRSEIKNSLRNVYQATRGGVFFEDGSPLAVSELAYSIYALPASFKNDQVIKKGITIENFAKDFQEMIGIEENYVLDALKSGKQYIAIARKIKPEAVAKLEEKYSMTLGLWNSEQQFVRIYPNGSVASKIIGFVRPDDEGKDIGQYGIEQYFDGILRGSEGIFEGQKDNEDNVIVNRDFDSVSSKNGINITLTIDRNIQALLEQKLMWWLNKTKSKEVSAVIMEVNTGRVIAMGNVPTYDPNKYWEGELVDCNIEYYKVLHKKCNPEKPAEEEVKIEEQKKKDEENTIYPDGYLEQLRKLEAEQKRLEEEKKKLEEALNADKGPELTTEEQQRLLKYPSSVRTVFRKESLPPGDVYRNSAASSIYEPGSVIKVLTLSTAYNFETIPVDPNYSLGSHKGCEEVIDVVLCTNSKRAVSSLNVEQMLNTSDNIGAFRIAQTMPAKDFAETFQRYGLGQTSGIELADEPFFRMKAADEWTKVDLSTGAFGQGSVAFTPLQMTAAWNALASNGTYYKPTVVKAINDNGQIKNFDPQPLRQVVTPEAAKNALDVNTDSTKRGNIRAREFFKSYSFSGKTATANIPKPDGLGYLPNALNMGYVGVAPAENPKFTMFVWFNEPKLGENGAPAESINTAQWAWLDIADELMIKFNIPPKTSSIN